MRCESQRNQRKYWGSHSSPKPKQLYINDISGVSHMEPLRTLGVS
jgi:hypothetical protein